MEKKGRHVQPPPLDRDAPTGCATGLPRATYRADGVLVEEVGPDDELELV
jgi:hypothetical protein